jgi:hypothetical protein
MRMIDSIRRITLSVCFVVLVSFSISASLSSTSAVCPEKSSCLASAVLYLFDINAPVAGSTVSSVPPQELDVPALIDSIRVVSLYGLLVSILMLLILESMQPHYLKNMFGHKNKRKRLSYR